MPTYVWQKQAMTAGEVRVSPEFVVVAGLTRGSATLDMNTAEMRDPSTHIIGRLEFFNEPLGVWEVMAAMRFLGHAANSVANQPSLTLDGRALQHVVGARGRGAIEALSAGNYGATLEWS